MNKLIDLKKNPFNELKLMSPLCPICQDKLYFLTNIMDTELDGKKEMICENDHNFYNFGRGDSDKLRTNGGLVYLLVSNQYILLENVI